MEVVVKAAKIHERIEFGLTALLFAIVVVTALVYASPTKKSIGRDSGAFLYIGSLINDSKLPYRHAWDSKPPAIFYVNALGLFIGNRTRWGVWGLEFGCLLTAAAISYLTMKKLWGALPALGGTLCWLWGLNLLFAATAET